MAPKSIIAWLKDEGWSVGNSDCARAENSFFPSVELIGVSIPK
jgi:hypothetical protein